LRCDVIAEGVIAAAKELKIKVPLVVRLEGTKLEEGKKLMSESGIDIITAENLSDAAKKTVSSVMKEL
jgi:succinyl-CoA synthetase beta subunit